MRIAGRIIYGAIAVLVLASAAATASAHARTSMQYRIEGRGWGHGIGMSQYGAEGYAAKLGWNGQQIIEHYFTGTVVAPRPANGPTSVRVLLQSYLAPARMQLTSAGTVTQGSASMPLLAGDVVSMRAQSGQILVTRSRTGVPDATLDGGGSADPVIVPAVDGGVKTLFTADLAPRGTAWRGTLSGHLYEGKVSIINTLEFESYLRGVVPHEVPASWHQGALEAQAITARSYALRGIRTSGFYDLYSDTRSQAYGGMSAEEPSTDKAVADTAGKVARVGGPTGDVAQTFYFSTSAGRTAGNDEVWGSSPYSYLRSVDSPYEQASPYWFWKGDDIQRLTPRQLGDKLGVNGLRSATVRVHPSGYVKEVVARGAGGIERIGATTVQGKLGLRSTFFRLQPLGMSGPLVVREGAFVTLTGVMPRSGRTSLIVRRGSVSRTVPLTANAGPGRWRVRARMSGNLLASMTRTGIIGPRLFVASTATAQGQKRLRVLRAQRRHR